MLVHSVGSGILKEFGATVAELVKSCRKISTIAVSFVLYGDVYSWCARQCTPRTQPSPHMCLHLYLLFHFFCCLLVLLLYCTLSLCVHVWSRARAHGPPLPGPRLPIPNSQHFKPHHRGRGSLPTLADRGGPNTTHPIPHHGGGGTGSGLLPTGAGSQALGPNRVTVNFCVTNGFSLTKT